MNGKVHGLAALVRQFVHAPNQSRHILRWARAHGRSPLDCRLPWLAFDVIDLLDREVNPQSRIFEYGGGGSTMWFADRTGAVVTVEHDEQWATALAAAAAEVSNLTVLRRDSADGYRGYVGAIDDFPDGNFDVIVVDGRERVRCVIAAMRKVRPNGLLLLDDSDRPRYAEAHRALASWEERTITGLSPFKPVAGTTTVWRRPADWSSRSGSTTGSPEPSAPDPQSASS